MKYLLLMLAIVGIGCGDTTDDSGKPVEFGLQVVKVDSCEYVLYIKSNACAMVHSGNCHNPKHNPYYDQVWYK